MDWAEHFQHELRNAELARARGNEGQARVCARRAAGIAAAEYHARRGLHASTGSALDLLRDLLTDDSVPAAALPAVESLVMQVNSDFQLPPGVDLIAEARRLPDLLLLSL